MGVKIKTALFTALLTILTLGSAQATLYNVEFSIVFEPNETPFIDDPLSGEIYFHMSAVEGAEFDELEEGDRVDFTERAEPSLLGTLSTGDISPGGRFVGDFDFDLSLPHPPDPGRTPLPDDDLPPPDDNHPPPDDIIPALFIRFDGGLIPPPDDTYPAYAFGLGTTGVDAAPADAPYLFVGIVSLADPVPTPVLLPIFGFASPGVQIGTLSVTITPVAPVVVEVDIDIKPGSDTNSINIGSAGVIPVAILSSATFDAATVNPDTIALAGARVKVMGKSDKYLCSERDVNGDGLPDLVCNVYTAEFMIEIGETIAVLEANTFDGTSIRGEDIIRIVPDQ